ncbi:hypothetical protein BDV95DRAFT_504302 [Massariosphaeria phaeospora]|uniref:Methyltransferase type 11 domain-containing protein n=1 Tax=Massariosphaeria phaeospora TaxID=100035 RepID=A0A7C8I337_9PLEO|nr:hypothetical protein BDV95DRAFT_504302 [Massariosphaeria phaeospora]
MFSADLSWVDPDTEKVGQRKERIARERSASATPSLKSTRSSKSSIPEDRELWWTTGLKKAKNLKPTRARPETSYSTIRPRKVSSVFPPTRESQTDPLELKDPTLQPAYTYTTKLSPALPSGASLDLPENEVPELEGDYSSRYTNSSGSRSSRKFRRLESPGKAKAVEEVQEVQQFSHGSFVTRTTRCSSETVEVDEVDEEIGAILRPKEVRMRRVHVIRFSSAPRRPYSVRIEGTLDLEALKLRDEPEESVTELQTAEKHPSYASGLPDSHLVAWRPPSDWNIVLDSESSEQKKLQLNPEDEIAVAHSSTLELTRFQRFIRRMENAGPRIILDRLKEEWHEPADEEADEELMLEKQLWVLTAFQLQNLSGPRVIFPRPKCNTGKILELYGNLSEVYQLSAMHPSQTVHYLTTKPKRPIPLPGNVSYLTVPQPGIVPLPYSSMSFSHIRASNLPSLIPSAKLPHLFRECYRLLAPGGLLEIRIMDAAPVRKTAGPCMKAWIEDRLSLNLERLFRCSKPCMLVSNWVRDAGFQLLAISDANQNLQLPCAFDDETGGTDGELSTLVGRALWKDVWGGFVDDVPGEPRWWWDDEEVMQECKERKTVFECGAIYAYKD